MAELRVVGAENKGEEAKKAEPPKPPTFAEIESSVLIAAMNTRNIAAMLINRELTNIISKLDQRPSFERLEHLVKLMNDAGGTIIGGSAIARTFGMTPPGQVGSTPIPATAEAKAEPAAAPPTSETQPEAASEPEKKEE